MLQWPCYLDPVLIFRISSAICVHLRALLDSDGAYGSTGTVLLWPAHILTKGDSGRSLGQFIAFLIRHEVFNFVLGVCLLSQLVILEGINEEAGKDVIFFFRHTQSDIFQVTRIDMVLPMH